MRRWKQCDRERLFAITLYVALTLLMILSLRNAVIHSQDFQWSGARVLLQGLNPYQEYLSESSDHFFIKSQAPNYLHFYYLFLLPFGLLSASAANLAWGLCNILMLSASLWLLIGYMNIRDHSRQTLIFLLLLMFAAFPARNAIGNGQASIFVLFTTVLGVCFQAFQNRIPAGKFFGSLIYGLSYSKYSFMPSFAAFLLVTRGLRHFLVSLVPSLLGCLVFLVLFRDLSVLNGPISVSSLTMLRSYGLGDLLSVVSHVFGGLTSGQFRILGYLFLLISCLVVWRCRKLEPRRLFAITAIGSLIFVTHLGYDYSILAIPLAFAFSPFASRLDKFVIGVHFFWIGFVVRIMYQLDVSTSWSLYTVFASNVMVLVALALPAFSRQFRYSPDTASDTPTATFQSLGP